MGVESPGKLKLILLSEVESLLNVKFPEFELKTILPFASKLKLLLDVVLIELLSIVISSIFIPYSATIFPWNLEVKSFSICNDT